MAIESSPLSGEVLALDAAIAWRRAAAAAGRVVVHPGHVQYLAWARAQGDALIVGLNSDESVRALKGAQRPICPFADRAALLVGLRSVDVVVGFAERTPEVVLDRIAPDIHVKSAQYRIDELPERYVVESHGGRILLAPHAAGKSTTDIVARIRRSSYA
jgi:rfaE bifunctional protein nucleotidyltransferase chain/domain